MFKRYALDIQRDAFTALVFQRRFDSGRARTEGRDGCHFDNGNDGNHFGVESNGLEDLA